MQPATQAVGASGMRTDPKGAKDSPRQGLRQYGTVSHAYP